MLANVEYENLKQEILCKITSCADLEMVKYIFKEHINSRRSFSKIKMLSDLLNLLEIRDVLHCNDVTSLHYLGEKLNNKEIIKLVKEYEKLYVEESSCVCGGSYFSPPNRLEEIKNFDNYLDRAINNIALNIGCNWKILVRELKIPEHFIDDIEEKYPSDPSQQALKALRVWKKLNEEAADLDALKTALEARLCKRKGLGLHLLKPVIVVQ